MIADDNLWDDLFHGCAWAAYLEIWAETGRFPPDSEATRRRAYRLYEEALAEKNRCKELQGSGRSPLREAGQGTRSRVNLSGPPAAVKC